jgi:hypothetical protein
MASAKEVSPPRGKAREPAPTSWPDRLSALLNGAFSYLVRERALRLRVRLANPRQRSFKILGMRTSAQRANATRQRNARRSPCCSPPSS